MSHGKQLWLVGQFRWATKTLPDRWEFQGVFDSKDKAIKACKTELYFIAPLILNKEYPARPVKMKGAYYPLSKHRLTRGRSTADHLAHTQGKVGSTPAPAIRKGDQ